MTILAKKRYSPTTKRQNKNPWESQAVSYTIEPIMKTKTEHRVYKMSFASVYPLYVLKAQKKGRTQDEVDEIICWLTGYTKAGLKKQIKIEVDFETFFKQAPKLNPKAKLITGSICGVKIAEIKEPLMKKIRYLDKLIDELAKGKEMDAIQRR